MNAVEILKKHGAEDIRPYELVNNYGFLFTKDGKRYDARYWANCYGCPLNCWVVDEMPNNEHKEIEKELNKEV